MFRRAASLIVLGLILSQGDARAEGQALSANGGSSGTETARVGSGNQSPDVKTPYTPPAKSPLFTSGEGKLPVNGAADRPND